MYPSVRTPHVTPQVAAPSRVVPLPQRLHSPASGCSSRFRRGLRLDSAMSLSSNVLPAQMREEVVGTGTVRDGP